MNTIKDDDLFAMRGKSPISISDADLDKILGPKQDRDVSLHSLAYDDDAIDEIISRLPGKGGIINTRKRFGKSHKNIEDNPSFVNDLMKAVINMLADNEVLLGHELLPLNLDKERQGLMKLPWDVFIVRPDVNRELNVGHIIKNVLRKWDIQYNDPIFARICTKDGSDINHNNWEQHLANDNLLAVINDHQHGGAGRYLQGAPYALVDPIFSNLKSTDSEMYQKRNGVPLIATWEQQARNSAAVARDKQAEGTLHEVHETDLAIYEWTELLKKLKVDFQSSSLPKDKGITNRGKDLYKYYNNKKWQPFYEDVILMHRRIWPEGELTHEVPWGVFTFLSYYKSKHNYTTAMIKELLKKIEIVLKNYYPDDRFGNKYFNRAFTKPSQKDPFKKTFWGDANLYSVYLEQQHGDDWRTTLDKGVKMASMLHHMLLSFNKYLIENGKTPIVKGTLPDFKSESNNIIGYKNPFRIYGPDNDIIQEYDYDANVDNQSEVDYNEVEHAE